LGGLLKPLEIEQPNFLTARIRMMPHKKMRMLWLTSKQRVT